MDLGADLLGARRAPVGSSEQVLASDEPGPREAPVKGI